MDENTRLVKLNIIKKIIRWYKRRTWWKKEFSIVQRQHWFYFTHRCAICSAGNPNLLYDDNKRNNFCKEDKPCPCEWNEYLERKNHEKASDNISYT